MGFRVRQTLLNSSGPISSFAKWRESLYLLQRLLCALNEIMCEKCLRGGMAKTKHCVTVVVKMCACVVPNK